MAMVVGFMAGATIVFSIPMGLAMLDKRDHKYMALGVMSGILTVPIGAFITSAILSLTNAQVRAEIASNGDSTYAFDFVMKDCLCAIYKSTARGKTTTCMPSRPRTGKNSALILQIDATAPGFAVFGTASYQPRRHLVRLND